MRRFNAIFGCGCSLCGQSPGKINEILATQGTKKANGDKSAYFLRVERAGLTEAVLPEAAFLELVVVFLRGGMVDGGRR